MSVSDVEFFFEPLASCVSEFESLKTLQIVPSLHILSNDDVYGLMGLNNLGILLDLGGSRDEKPLLNSIVSLIRENTLCCLLLDSEISHDTTVEELVKCRCDYIYNNTHVAFMKYRDVDTGKMTLNKEILPIFFVNFEYIDHQAMYNMLRNFKECFSLKSRRVIELERTSITNLVPLSCEEIFYICREKNFNMELEDGSLVEVSFSDGFPATDSITDLYKTSGTEIAISNNYNPYAYVCPEVNFYKQAGFRFKQSFLTFNLADIEERIL